MCSLVLLCLAMTSPAGAADVPQLINVQGKLTDAVGDPVTDGLYPVVFTIYTAASGGSVLWQEPDTVEASDGLFSIGLGENVTLPASLFDSTELWLGIKVHTDPEMTPRQRLTTAPYSFRSSGAAVGGGWADDGNIVRLETSTDSVGIGTASPSARLHVVESNGTAVQAFSNGGTGAAAGLYAYSDTWHAVLGINSNSNAAIMGRNDGSGPGIKGQNQGTGPAITGYASSGNLLELYNTPGPNLRFSISNDGYVQADSTIESTSGGFKFPDGTVQTTAASHTKVQSHFSFVTYKPGSGVIAYGMIQDDGTIKSGTGNFSCAWNATSDRYEITITGESYLCWDYATVVTPMASAPYIPVTNSISGKLIVYIFDSP